jgi:hypothetical protein
MVSNRGGEGHISTSSSKLISFFKPKTPKRERFDIKLAQMDYIQKIGGRTN